MDEQNPHRYTKEQWVSFSMLLLFGVTVVVLGGLQMRNTIYNPFSLVDVEKEKKEQLAIYENDQVKLQSIDTDHDGINDYEEIEFYATSPYLPDTDSDGIEDKKELDQKTDPLCPQGQKCDIAKEIPAASVTSTGLTPVLSDYVLPTSMGNTQVQEGITADGSIDIAAMITNPQQLRAIMLQSGNISADDLNKVSDAELKELAQKLYQEKFIDINKTATSTGGNVSSSTSP